MLEELRDFSQRHVSNHHGLFDPQNFPLDLFLEMGQRKLLDAADPSVVARGSAIIARESGSLGFAMAWMVNALVPLVLEKYASLPAEIKTGLANGTVNIALAISESGAGAHPKFLKTSAEQTAEGWILNGQKAYITNGPIASHLAVLAITGITGDRKEFSLFLIPISAPGLIQLPHPQFEFLRPAQHCGFALENCLVSQTALLGHPGRAYEEVALPFRNLEDAISVCVMSAALSHVFHRTAQNLQTHLKDEISLQLAELAGIEIALSDISGPILTALEGWETGMETVELRLIAMRDLIRRVSKILSRIRTREDDWIDRILLDIEKTLDIAHSAHQIRQVRLGRKFFTQKNINEGSY